MILVAANVLPQDKVKEIRDKLKTLEFYDGQKTAGYSARLVKNNLQLSRNQGEELHKEVRDALRKHPVFHAAVIPRHMSRIIFSRYEKGMKYGTHVDDAVMGKDTPFRSDVSFTLFLSNPDEYEGGELVMEKNEGEQAVKLPAGSAILYPSTSLHRVAEVTSGTREVAIGWVQSMVRQANHREILFDLERLKQGTFKKEGKSETFDLLAKCHANLLREWAEM